MAILQLKQDQFMVVNGWYGKCHDAAGNLVDDINCPEFDLTAHTAKIKSVYQVKSDNSVHSYDSSAQSSTNDFTKLKCGGSYLIYLQKGIGTLDVPHFVASYPDGTSQGRITDNCETEPTGPADFKLDLTSSEISEEVDVGYDRAGTTDYDANEHLLVSNAVGVQTLQISANSNILEYSTNGTNWSQLTSTHTNIASTDIANLKVRLRSNLNSSSSAVVVISLVGIPENTIYNNLEKSVTITVTINSVNLSALKAITETIEEGAFGEEYSFDISYSALKSIWVSGGTDEGYQISTSPGGTYSNTLSFDSNDSTLPASPIKIYVKLTSEMPATTVSNIFLVSGITRRDSAINMSGSVVATATVAPRPQITSLSVNPNTLVVSASFSNRNNYGGHHWHYDVKQKSNNSPKISTQMPGFDDSITLQQSLFIEATTFVLTAFIVNQSHQPIPGSDIKTAEFTITANDAVLSINKSGVSGVIDIDDTFQTTSVNITSNNLSNIRYSSSTLNNWEFLSQTPTEFSVRLKSDLKNSDLSSGPNILPQETLTITGDVGPRDTSGDSTKSVTFTLNQTIVDNAEFSITAPGGNFTVTDTRNYDGTSMPEFGPFTINSDAVTLSSNILNNWEVKIGTGTWTKSPNFAIAVNGTTFKVRQTNVSVGTYNEILTITPTANLSDNDPSDNPNAINITLNGKINANIATLSNPGKQTLTTIISGNQFSTKTFTVGGQFVKDITISSVSTDWSVTPASPNVGDTVTVAYTGSNEPVGTKSGSFTISASPVTGATLSTTSYTVNLEVTINPKTSVITASPTAITLDDILSGDPSSTKTLTITSGNVDDIKITSIPSGFIVKQGTTTLANNASIGATATLTISISDTNTLGNRTGTLTLSGVPSANSVFSGANTKNVNLNAKVNGLPTSLTISPTSVTNSVNQYDSLPSATSIAINQSNLESVTITGGSTTTYQVSSTENGTYTNSLTLDMPATVFYVKLMSTNTSGNITRSLTVSGTKTSIGASNPANKTLSCSATVTAFTAGILLSPTSITETYDQNATTTAKQVSLTLDDISSLSITASGKYSVSETENGTFSSSVTLSNPGASASFFVKCSDTSTAGTATGTITVVGTHTLGGGSTTKTLNCSATINEVDTGGGDGGPCEECKPELNFDFHTDTLGGTETAFGTNNYTINGFEAGGSLCFNALHVATPSAQASITVHNSSFSIFGSVMPTTQIVNGYIIYKAADGTFYDGTLSESSNMCLISPANCTSGGGDSAPCETCDSSASFDFHTDTLGGTETAFGTNNYTINGFEAGGSLCFNALHVATPSAQASITVHNSSFSIFGSVMPTTQIVNGDIIYKSSSGTCYRGTLSEGSNMCLISEM